MKAHQAHKWNIADTVTASRIALSLVLLFLPYALVLSYGTGFLKIVCALALLAAAEELAIDIRFKEYRADRKSILRIKE